MKTIRESLREEAYRLYLKGIAKEAIASRFEASVYTINNWITIQRKKDPYYKMFDQMVEEKEAIEAIFKRIAILEEKNIAIEKRINQNLNTNYQLYKKTMKILKSYINNKEDFSMTFLARNNEMNVQTIFKIIKGNHPVLKLDLFLTAEEQKMLFARMKKHKERPFRTDAYTITRTDVLKLKDFQENIEFWIQLMLECRLDLASLGELQPFSSPLRLFEEMIIYKNHMYEEALSFLEASVFKTHAIKRNNIEGAKQILETKSSQEALQSFLLNDTYAAFLGRKKTPLSAKEEYILFRYKLKYVLFDLNDEKDLYLLRKYGDSYLLRSILAWDKHKEELKSHLLRDANYNAYLSRKKKMKNEKVD